MTTLKKSLLLAVGIVLVLIIPCATSGPFKAYIAEPDHFNPDRIHYFSDPITIKGVQFLSTSFAFFRIHCVRSNSGTLWYLETTYCSNSWLFVDMLKFVADGTVTAFESQPNPKREVGYLGTTNIFEENKFVIPDAFLDGLRTAQNVAVRLVGEHYYVERTLTRDDVHNIGWFLDFVQSELTAES